MATEKEKAMRKLIEWARYRSDILGFGLAIAVFLAIAVVFIGQASAPIVHIDGRTGDVIKIITRDMKEHPPEEFERLTSGFWGYDTVVVAPKGYYDEDNKGKVNLD